MSTKGDLDECENGDYCVFGAETLLKLLRSCEDQIVGTRESEDIEYVHKMRVASRRLRTALPLFCKCLPKKRYKKWLREVRKVTRFLGAARDLDVQMVFIDNYLKNLHSSRNTESLDLLRSSHERRRAKAQNDVVRGLQELQDSNVMQGMTAYCSEMSRKYDQCSSESPIVIEKAYYHISSRIDDFLALKDYVYLPNEIRKHHEMRISAKWLRYTLETFSPLYEGELREEISTIKKFQDTLGEMHDCDIWIEYIPKFIKEMKTCPISKRLGNKDLSREQDLLNFLNHTVKRRKDYYDEFVCCWDQTKEKSFFDQLRRTTQIGLISPEEKMSKVLADPTAKVAILADVHANLHALQAVIKDAEQRNVSIFLNAGDIIGFGAFPNEVIELLQTKNVTSVIGNYDLEVLGEDKEGKSLKKLPLKFARKELTKPNEAYLRSLPSKLLFNVGGKKLLIVHGSPESIEEHLYPDAASERLEELAEMSNADIIVVGHSHVQFTRQVPGVLFANPGSVGRPGDGNPQAAYGVLNSSPFSIELLRLDYDVKAEAEALRKKRLPESFSQMLLRGLSLDEVITQDRIRESQQNCKELARVSRSVAKKYWKDTAHSEQVRRISLKLFDCLGSEYQLNSRERCFLECAAILHDVGLSEGLRSHHKASLKLILDDMQLPFSSNERRVVGSVVRYHRKGSPKEDHYNLAALSRKDKRVVFLLSSLLRVADALDFTHQSIVRHVEARENPRKVILECSVRTDYTLEDQALNKKKDLFEKFLKRRLQVVWKKL